jgi:hypothetical protein
MFNICNIIKHMSKNKNQPIQLSQEQQSVITYVKNNQSVIIDAVAGSGKTTTVLGLAKELSNMYILQVTYNAHLKTEVKEKVFKQKIENLEIHTYHSLCLKYYRCHKDEQIKNVLEFDVKPKKEIPQFSLIVIDEVQDMRNMYYNFILKFINDLGKSIPIIVCGDKYQGIYEFSDADTRFLTLADKLYHTNFVRQDFKISYRVTNPIATFLNTHIIGYNRIVSGNLTNVKPVKYIICDKKNNDTISYIVNEIVTKLKLGFLPSDFFILSYTVKHNDFLKEIENILSGMGICIYYENSDEEKTPDSKLIDNKLVFTTIHCSKGRERKFVFFDGFDSSFDYFCKKSKKNPKMCSSELYTALTRASDELYLIHDSTRSRIGCLTNYNVLAKSCYINIIQLNSPKPRKEFSVIKNIFSATDLINHLGSTLIELQPNIVDLFEQLVSPIKVLTIKDTIEDPIKKITENVTDINGLVIPMIYESLTDPYNDCYILKKVKEQIHILIQDETEINKILCTKFNTKTKIQEYITIGIFYSCLCSGLIHKSNQIFNKDWLNLDDVKECHKHLSSQLSGHPKWEQSISGDPHIPFIYVHPKYGTIEIYNRIDAIDDENVWELKCVNGLTLEHKLQLIIYYFIYRSTNKTDAGKKDFKLLNMKSGEVLILIKDDVMIDYIMERIFETKVMVKDKMNDNDFIQVCHSSKYYSLTENLKSNSDENSNIVTEEQKLDRLDIVKLKEKAKRLKIKKFSTMTKKQIIDKIVDQQKGYKKMSDYFITVDDQI